MQYYDITVADRTVVDVIAYTQVAGFDSLFDEQLRMGKQDLERYQTIFFNTIQENNHLHPDGVRDSEDPKFRQDIEDALLGLYEELGMNRELGFFRM